MKHKIFALLTALTLFSSGSVFACPAIDKIPDYNCDGKLVITILGDSIAYGFGDTKYGNKGGYVLRAAKKLDDIEFHNLGVPGQRTLDLLQQIDKIFNGESEASAAQALYESDIVILDEGRNDRWLFGLPSATYRNLKRASDIIKKNVLIVQDTAPLVVTAVLMLPNRGSQGPWVKELNAIIFKKSSTKNPADLRFDLVSKRLLGSDQIHPTSKGYDSLAKTLISYLTINLPKKIKVLHPDSDSDGIPDVFEINRYGTDPNNADSDDDGIPDGQDLPPLPTPTATPTVTPVSIG